MLHLSVVIPPFATSSLVVQEIHFLAYEKQEKQIFSKSIIIIKQYYHYCVLHSDKQTCLNVKPCTQV